MEITLVKRARRNYICSICKSKILKGDSYYRGRRPFERAIIRCNNCKLQDWELNPSEYIQRIFNLIHTWKDTYPIIDFKAHIHIISELEFIKDQIQDYRNSMSKTVKAGIAGKILDDRYDAVQFVINLLSDIDRDEIELNILTDSNEADDYDNSESKIIDFKQQVLESYEEIIDSCLQYLPDVEDH